MPDETDISRPRGAAAGSGAPAISLDEPLQAIRPTGLERLQQSPLPPAALLIVAAVVLPVALALGLGYYQVSDAVILGAVVAALGGAVILARPFWGLVLFVGLLYARPEESIAGLAGLRLPLIVALVTMAGTWLHLFLDRQRMARSPLTWTMVGFGVVAVASTFGKGTTSLVAGDIAKLVVLVLLVLNLVRSPRQYRSLLAAVVVFTAYLAGFSIYLYLTGTALDRGGEHQTLATGIFSDPNDLSATIVAGLALVLAGIAGTRSWTRLGLVALASLMVMAIWLTHSRGGFLALLAVAGASVALFSRRRALGIGLAAVVVLTLFAASSGRMRNFDTTDESANGRFWFWSAGVDVFFAHPLLGVGYNQFADYNEGHVAHNSFVQCFAELGALGYFFWMGCLYYAFRRRATPAPDGSGDSRDEEARERNRIAYLAPRIALGGFLVAAFWISRTYVPVLYLLIALPVVQQMAAQPSPDADEAPPDRPAGRVGIDLVSIALLCAGSFLFIKTMAERLR